MALSGLRNQANKTDYVKNYDVNASARFNFTNKKYVPNQAKVQRFLDAVIDQSKKVPSPDKYNHLPEFLSKNKKHTIYKTDRRLSIDEVIETSKKTPGVGHYKMKESYDEKFVKPPVGTGAVKQL